MGSAVRTDIGSWLRIPGKSGISVSRFSCTCWGGGAWYEMLFNTGAERSTNSADCPLASAPVRPCSAFLRYSKGLRGRLLAYTVAKIDVFRIAGVKFGLLYCFSTCRLLGP